jgi:hypothetical protein
MEQATEAKNMLRRCHVMYISEWSVLGGGEAITPYLYAVVFCICNIKKLVVPVVFVAITKSSL